MATHHFTPTHYYNTIGSHAPVLRVADGDTILTACVDAAGQDDGLRTLAEGPNPMSGPFFVDGAEPGDTLAVHVDRIVPSRASGWTRNTLAYNVVDPDYARVLPERSVKGEWQVDVAAGVATLTKPRTALGSLKLPLSPMVGCFGVAPAANEAISTATSGPHGGNMDWNGFVPGVTVYFPVFVPGALLHMGDGHALQGDGEISGTGIEISTEMQMTVRVIKGRTIGWPRGENADFIFTAGNARPLDQAMQHATTEMSRWLADEYHLDHLAIGLLMGQAVRYELGNMYDPAYTMICKVPKSVLAGLKAVQRG